MICFPNAKINLGLYVVSKRLDGYHDIETIFLPLKVYDALEIIVNTDAQSDTLHIHGLPIDGDVKNNLVMKAVRAMRSVAKFPPIEIHLLKKIPFGAGLGGGSADASFMLRLLNDAFYLEKSDEELAHIAVGLGADCPFFIYNKPMYATGIGERLQPVDIQMNDYSIVLVNPDIHVSTKDAFCDITPCRPATSLLDAIQLPVEKWRDTIQNDFEQTVFKKFPDIQFIKESLYDAGAVYASMSGSGSAVWGLFPKNCKVVDLPYKYQIIEI